MIDKLVHSEYFSLILIGFIFFVIFVFALIVLINVYAKRKKHKQYMQNADNMVSSLTQNEIENISKNSANPDEIKEILRVENERILNSKQKKKKSKKAVEDNSSTNSEPLKIVEEKVEKQAQPKTSKTKRQSVKKESVKAEKPASKKEDVKVEKTQYVGKWKISKNGDKFYAELYASNGGLLLKTMQYTSLSGAKNGIETIKKNIDTGSFEITLDKYGHYSFRLYSVANRMICVSEDYSSKVKCENGISSVKRFAKSAVITLNSTVFD